MGSADGWGLPRNTAELQGAIEPLAAAVPGDGGCLFQSLTLEQRRLNGESHPAATVDLIRDSLVLRLEAIKANRDWIDGLSEEDVAAAQWASEGELVDEGRQTFTTGDAFFEVADKPTSFGAFFGRRAAPTNGGQRCGRQCMGADGQRLSATAQRTRRRGEERKHDASITRHFIIRRPIGR